jgi:hypothetical protein
MPSRKPPKRRATGTEKATVAAESDPPPNRAAGVSVMAPTIFLSAFLLFLVQPLIASYILPWFGGSSAVWTTAMLFFQLALVAGYTYAHLSVSFLSARKQAGLHAGLLLAAIALLPTTPAATWKPTDATDPSWRILVLLAANVGLPFVLLASSSPLLQAWSHRLRPNAAPERLYRLYALGNAGSLLALFTYPFAMEPLLGRAGRATTWSIGFAIFALASAACAATIWRHGEAQPEPVQRKTKKRGNAATARHTTSGATRALWLLLPATASLLLLAVTHQISQDVAPIPFLWILPLAIYLISFMLVFESDRWYRRSIFLTGLIPAMLGTLVLLQLAGLASITGQVVGWSGVLFVCCMVCHGEAARLKPPAERLTDFYLSIAVGGALGGIGAALLAPLIFDLYLELHLGLWLTCLLGLIAFARDRSNPLRSGLARWAWLPIALAGLILTIGLLGDIRRTRSDAIEISRTFHGVLRVNGYAAGTPSEAITLTHGRTTHGLQFQAPERRRWPTLYFSWYSGAGLAMRHYQPQRPRKVGIVGMGAGTLAFFGREGDEFRFYELDAAVAKIALSHFSFVNDSQAKGEIVIGDARSALERESSNSFDLLFLDAFNSDSIPVHLLTLEAFDIYNGHLKPDGVIAANISSAHLDLEPLIRGLAAHLGMQARSIHSAADGARAISSAHWMLLSRDTNFLDSEAITAVSTPSNGHESVLWTDDHANVLAALRSFAN